ncbi:two component transcriptional regulator, AraC family [Anaerovirgula multivorans]|uniref:Stage 0 sporulation protein A homolog n=1 Tax=Anaerovirgula multivorans TaxID=312168 RepID=A0A239EXK2_9FIRM|nr:response regulator [Anaerovirgula multivorans]SNS48642.1 two component transcriptional regulator, AraC family [Anaerovirgula multivorans]
MKLLIVDDEKMMKEYTKFVIQEENLPITVFEASNGEEAIALAEKLQPDVIFMDIKMPQVNGLEATETIKQQQPSATVIFLSAYDKFEYAQKALRLGAYDYLLKPIPPKDLKNLLKRLLDDQKQRQAAVPQEEKQQEIYEDQVILKAKEYVEDHYHSKIHLQNVADYVGLSSTYFSKFFKQKTAVNFSNYLNQVRIQKSKELMRNPNLSLNEISYRVGYEDLSYFSIVFQRYEGITPTGYRRQLMTK